MWVGVFSSSSGDASLSLVAISFLFVISGFRSMVNSFSNVSLSTSEKRARCVIRFRGGFGNATFDVTDDEEKLFWDDVRRDRLFTFPAGPMVLVRVLFRPCRPTNDSSSLSSSMLTSPWSLSSSESLVSSSPPLLPDSEDIPPSPSWSPPPFRRTSPLVVRPPSVLAAECWLVVSSSESLSSSPLLDLVIIAIFLAAFLFARRVGRTPICWGFIAANMTISFKMKQFQALSFKI